MPAENWPTAEDAASASSAAAPGMADYDAILAAVMETERGRWFLAEYARRNRQADTAEVLAAVERLAATARPALADPQPDRKPPAETGVDIDLLRAGLADMANAIARAKTEIASIRPDAAPGGHSLETTGELDSAVRTTERATSDILAVAERVQDVAWTMREQGMESQFCDRLDGYAAEIYTACSLQELSGQRTRKIIQVLHHLEARIQAMTGMWGAATQAAPPAAPAPEPAAGSGDLVQSGVDPMMEPPMPAPVAAAAVEAPVAESVDDVCADRAASSLPATVPVNEANPTLTIEGPTGSFSILAGRVVEPEDAQPAATPLAPPPPSEPDPIVADLRALAANLIAGLGKDPADPHDVPPAPPAAPAPPAEKPPRRQDEIVLPLTAAPPLGEPPQRPAPEPAARRSSDLAEGIFADVMALTGEERIALFT